MDDAELARIHIGVIARDHDSLVAFEAFMRGRAVRSAKRFNLPDEDVEEIWQDVFLNVVDRAPGLEPLGRSLVRYTLTAVHNSAVDRVRVKARRGDMSLEATDPDAEWRLRGSGASSISDGYLELLHRCLEAVGLTGARVLEMVARGMTAAEIAIVIDKSPAAAAKVWQRARDFMQQCLGGAHP